MNTTSQPPIYLPQRERLGHPTAAWVFGVFGVVLGLIPLLFLLAFGGGIVALALGVGAWRAGKRAGVKQGRAGIVLGPVALTLGVVGFVIVADVTEQLDEDLTCIDEAGTFEELDACND